MAKNLPRDLVDKTCNQCELLPTKPGIENYPAPLLAAANAVSFTERLIKAGVTVNIERLSARKAHALVAMIDGRDRSERNRVKQGNSSKTQQTAEERSKQLLQKGGEGAMDD